MKRKSTKNSDTWQLGTELVHGGRIMTELGETSEALFLNSAYSYETAEIGEGRFAGTIDGFKYGRYSHPNLAMFEQRMALMEGADACIATGSGMSAMFASLMGILRAGDHVVASRVLFSSCHYIITEILPRFNISYTLVDCDDLAAWNKAITKKTRAVFVETPANPTLQLVDIKAVASLCKKAGAIFIVDNVFATPLLQGPLTLGADLVMYSTTKHIDGQGRTLGGAILGSTKLIEDTLRPFCRHTGPHMSAFNAWILLKSLETLELRVERHCSNTARIAEILEDHPKVKTLYYPGSKSFPQYALAQKQMRHGGPMVSFEIKGGKKAAFLFMNALRVFDISNNLGNAKSLATHPASTTHRVIPEAERKAIGITDSLIRLSPGIEDIRDLERDILEALKSA